MMRMRRRKVIGGSYVLNEEVLAQAVELLSREHLENVQMDSTHISGTLNLDEAGRLILSVPYEKDGSCGSMGKRRSRRPSVMP